jgi:hypothetical protein
MGGMMTDIDGILARYEQELLYFEYTRDELQPLMEELVSGLEAYFASRDDPQVLEGVRGARQQYVARLAELRPLVEHWVSIRGSNDLAWEAEPEMDDAQGARLQALAAREAVLGAGRARFDELQERIRSLLLVFEEATG